MLEEFVYPHLQRHFSLAHEYGIKVMFHSCGAVREIIPDLINLGVDILNPLQANAKGMAPDELKKEFGGKLCFHGSLDTQRTLPFGTEEEVRREVRDRVETLSPGGGFILSPAHNFQKNTPLANIIAMYDEAVRE
jgi:uroporphyrinogen decarboxylase